MAQNNTLHVKKLNLRLKDFQHFLIVTYANTFKGLLKWLKILFNVFLTFGRLNIFLYTFNFLILNNFNFLINIIYCTIDFFY